MSFSAYERSNCFIIIAFQKEIDYLYSLGIAKRTKQTKDNQKLLIGWRSLKLWRKLNLINPVSYFRFLIY